jgi:hypothetical protein
MRFCIQKPGFRTRVITIVTTLTDAQEYTRQDIAELYGFRWNSEVCQADCTSSAGLYQLAA